MSLALKRAEITAPKTPTCASTFSRRVREGPTLARKQKPQSETRLAEFPFAAFVVSCDYVVPKQRKRSGESFYRLARKAAASYPNPLYVSSKIQKPDATIRYPDSNKYHWRN